MFWCHFLCVQLLTRWSRSVQQQTMWYIHFDRYRLALNFYRATRTIPWRDLCLSVRHIHISSKFFHLWVARAILVFPYQTGWQYSDGDPLTKCKGGMKKFRMTLSDLAKYSMTRSVARSLCDSWASCSFVEWQKPARTVCVSVRWAKVTLAKANRRSWHSLVMTVCWWRRVFPAPDTASSLYGTR